MHPQQLYSLLHDRHHVLVEQSIIKEKKIVITGGAGFIGSNLARALCENNEVSVLDNLSTGRYENLSPIIKKIKFIHRDITNLSALHQAFDSADYVLHQAALPSVVRSTADPISSNYNNINGTLNVLVAARDCNIRRVVFASSSSVYGDTPILPKDESFAPNPMSPYAVTKLAGEHYCRVFHEVYGLETVALRYFNVFGPAQDPLSQYAAVIPKFVTALKKNERPVVYGDGEQSRDFTYVENVVNANMRACLSEKAAGKVINIACGERTSINQLLKLLNDLLDSNIKPIFKESRPGDVKHSLADISQAKRLLGYEPIYNLKTGLMKTIGAIG